MAEREAVLLVRLDGIGDAALCIPALEGMRRAFPGAAFGAVCSRANAALFSSAVQHIHVFSGKVGADFLAELRGPGYTRALVATEEVMGYKLGRLSGAGLRSGFWHGFQKPFKSAWQRAQVTTPVYRPAAWTKAPEHEVATLYRLAQALGAQSPPPCDTVSLRRWLRVEPSPNAQVADGALAFQINGKLFAGGWGPAAVASFVNTALASSGFHRGILIAAAQDVGLACAVLEHLPQDLHSDNNLRILASLELPQWLDALDRAGALVTPDTGAAHVAGMLGAAVVDLFEEPDFQRLSQQWHPWAGTSQSIMKPLYREGLEDSFGRRVGEAVRMVSQPVDAQRIRRS